MRKKLSRSFYLQQDVVAVSQELLGKFLMTKIDGQLTGGMIVETEAYNGVEDRASHAYNGRRTQRTEIMYCKGGTAYVYLCYGIHHLFNIVTNRKEVPQAVLIRAIEPSDGIKVMLQRREKTILKPELCAGPGIASRALGVTTVHTGTDLTGDKIWVENRGIIFGKDEIQNSERIGVEYAGAHARRLWRFTVKSNPCVSK